MQNRFPHIALFLLVLFGITLLPFNFLHHHAEDEHGIAIHHHEKEDTHHCELDEHFCQPFTDNCRHEQHISKTIAKCFSCEFHFIKHFTSNNHTVDFNTIVYAYSYKALQPEQLRKALILLSNKGPPALV